MNYTNWLCSTINLFISRMRPAFDKASRHYKWIYKSNHADDTQIQDHVLTIDIYWPTRCLKNDKGFICCSFFLANEFTQAIIIYIWKATCLLGHKHETSYFIAAIWLLMRCYCITIWDAIGKLQFNFLDCFHDLLSNLDELNRHELYSLKTTFHYFVLSMRGSIHSCTD